MKWNCGDRDRVYFLLRYIENAVGLERICDGIGVRPETYLKWRSTGRVPFNHVRDLIVFLSPEFTLTPAILCPFGKESAAYYDAHMRQSARNGHVPATQ